MLSKIKEKFLSKLKNEQGSIMLYTIIFMIFFLPFSIWVGVQIPIRYQQTYEIRQNTHNTADSMISRIDQTALSSGLIRVDPIEAYEVGDSMTKVAYKLDDDYQPSGGGVLREEIPFYFHNLNGLYEIDSAFVEEDGAYTMPKEPGVHAFVLNGIPEGAKIHFKGVKTPVEKTSVIVHSAIPIEDGGVFGSRIIIQRTGISEVEFNLGGNDD